MKNKVALFLLLTYTFCNTPFREVTKIPFLVLHYHQHLEENKAMSVWEYLDMHYMQSVVYDEDFHQDMQLPFKCMQDAQQMQVILFTSVQPACIPSANMYLYTHSSWRHMDWDIIQDLSVSGIFHPPRSGFRA